MNFCQGEYDAGASLASAQRRDHSTRESSSRTSTWKLQPILESASTQCRNSPLEARLNRCRILPFEANFEIVNRAGVSTSALECD
jgi:hypothetical protein